MRQMTLFRRLRVLLGALALAILPAGLVGAPVATAQGTTIIVYDQAQVMRDSKAGKDIAAKLKSMGDSTRAQLKPEGDALEAERKSLETRTANMTQQAIAGDAALRSQLESFGKKASTYAQKVQRIGQELALTERQAWSDFFTALEPVLKEVMTERGAQILLESGTTVLSNPSVDVTASVIAKLDSRVSTINVVRKTLPEQTQP